METLLFDTLETEIGTLQIVSDGEALRAVTFMDDAGRMRGLLRRHCGSDFALRRAGDPQGATSRLRRYFGGDLEALDGLRVRTNGTEFERTVWNALRGIRPGTTMSYGRLAAKLSRPKASRAVGAANRINPIGIVVPCHRVIGADGSLTGYAGGIERKRWLLEHEGVKLPRGAAMTR